MYGEARREYSKALVPQGFDPFRIDADQGSLFAEAVTTGAFHITDDCGVNIQRRDLFFKLFCDLCAVCWRRRW